MRIVGVTPHERNDVPFKNFSRKQGAKIAKRRLRNVFPVLSLVSTSIGSVQTRSLLQNSAEVEFSQASSRKHSLERSNLNLNIFRYFNSIVKTNVRSPLLQRKLKNYADVQFLGAIVHTVDISFI